MRQSFRWSWMVAAALLAACGGTNNTDGGRDGAGDARADGTGDAPVTDTPVMDTPPNDVQPTDTPTVDADDVQAMDMPTTDNPTTDTPTTEAGEDVVDPDAATDTGPTCTAPQILCGTTCVNPQTDMANCGACGNACASGESCVMGTCTRPCTAPRMMCGTVCVDPQTDNMNCGTCGTTCPTGQSCMSGVCRPTTTCTPPLVLCGTTCVDTGTDVANCGSCGRACASGQSCVAGTCTIVCPTGQTLCGGTCVDTLTDNSNCGACARACTGGQICRAGACITPCVAPNLMCGAACINPTTDVNNCGACGRVCTAANGTPGCAAGACTVASCNPGFGNCNMMAADGCETDLRSNNGNCGACGMACVGGATCSAGACVCPAGQTACGTPPVCRNLQTDNNNCGMCGRMCTAAQTCTAGACVAIAMPPANDMCAAATAIPLPAAGATATVMGSTANATASTNSCNATSRDVFYSFTLTQRSVVYVDTFGSGYDTRVGFRATCASASVACNDDSLCAGMTLASQTATILDPGTHFVEVGGYLGATGAFTLHLQWFPAGNGAGGRIANPSTTMTQTAMATTAGTGTGSTGCGGSGPDNTHWFFTCPSDPAQTLHASTCPSAGGNANFDTVIEERSAGRPAAVCNNDSGAACGNRSSTTSAIPAGAGLHVLRVDGFAGATGTYTLAYRYGTCLGTPAWTNCTGTCTETQTDTQNCGGCGNICATGSTCVTGACTAPPNDNCAAATNIVLGATGTTTTITGSTRGSTNGALSCNASPDVYYQFTIPAGQTEIVYLDTFGSAYDTYVGFQDNCAAAATACNDDSGCAAPNNLHSHTQAVLGPGVHRIVVDGFGGQVGAFTLHIQHIPIAAGSAIAGGVPAGAYSIVANTTGGANGVHLCGGGTATEERNYTWMTCPAQAAGAMSASTCSAASYDTVLQIRHGNTAATVCNDDAFGMCPAGGTRSIITGHAVPAGAGIHVLTVTGFGGQAGAATITGTRP